ncbi:MAG TPA: DUF1684 domain-containing protein [Actinocrinis sp.]|nr:DUF1684 domain-containing protein [Actinocrinis sp.]
MTGQDEWRQWHDERVARLREPFGILALVGTHWLEQEPAPIIPGEPVLWSGDATSVTVTAKAEHGLVLDGETIDGTVTLTPDTEPNPSTVTAAGQYRLVPIVREGVPALRVYDPQAQTRQDFLGVAAFDYAPDWVRPARFTAYPEQRTESVLNADGRYRGLDLVGTVEFTTPAAGEAEAQTHSFAVERLADGRLKAVFADATSGKSTFRFRFLELPAPAADGATVADFNRAHLPPCAFADHYVCPVPPAGNTLPLPVAAGEQSVQTR